MQRKNHVKTQRKDGYLQTKERNLQWNLTCWHFVLRSSLQSCEKIHFCYLSHSISGPLLLQSLKTNIGEKKGKKFILRKEKDEDKTGEMEEETMNVDVFHKPYN